MIIVYRNDVHVSTINFGWEATAFYQDWMADSSEDDIGQTMSGASIDMTSPDGVPPNGMLAFFHALLDEDWIDRFKTHYEGVKASVTETGEQQTKRCRTSR